MVGEIDNKKWIDNNWKQCKYAAKLLEFVETKHECENKL